MWGQDGSMAWQDEHGHLHPDADERVLPVLSRPGRLLLIAGGVAFVTGCVLGMMINIAPGLSSPSTTATLVFASALLAILSAVVAVCAPFTLATHPVPSLLASVASGLFALLNSGFALYLAFALGTEDIAPRGAKLVRLFHAASPSGALLEWRAALTAGALASLAAGAVLTVGGTLALARRTQPAPAAPR